MKNIFKRFIQFLNQPYPECKAVDTVFMMSLGIGVFIGLFLYVFEPFGMAAAGSQKAWYCTIFGLITFGVSFGTDLFTRFVLRIHMDTEDWVFWKWMLSVMGTLLLIALGNYLFLWSFSEFELSVHGFIQMLLATVLIGIFPVFFTGLINSSRNLRMNEALAKDITQQMSPSPNQTISLAPKASREFFEIDPAQVLMIEAMQNYVVVHYLADGQEQQKIIRNTLSTIEEKLKGSQIERSHRSYLVNRRRILKVTGNAQGLKLTIDGLENKYVPVSRKYVHMFQRL